jgi:hypothetical protein
MALSGESQGVEFSQLLGEQRKCLDERPRLPSTLFDPEPTCAVQNFCSAKLTICAPYRWPQIPALMA